MPGQIHLFASIGRGDSSLSVVEIIRRTVPFGGQVVDLDADVAVEDATWAFNQASGARLDAPLAEPRARNPDAHRAGGINRQLPSLNRHPGTIYVPPGTYYIYGTITLFAGQHLVGASSQPNDPNAGAETAPPFAGSVLVKVGRGPCIRVVPPNHMLRWPEPYNLDQIRALFREGAGDGRGDEDLLLANRFDLGRRLGLDAQQQLEEDGEDPGSVSRREQKAAMVRAVLNPGGAAFISHLRVEYREIEGQVAPAAPDELAASSDAFASLAARDIYLTVPLENDLGQRHVLFRSTPIEYDSGGIEIVNSAFGRIRDVAVHGFDRGFGLLAYSDNSAANSIGNRIDRLRITDCHRGLVLLRTFGNPLKAEPKPAELIPNVPNAGQVVFRTRIEASINNTWTVTGSRFERCTVAGVECWAPTPRFLYCHFDASSLRRRERGPDGAPPPLSGSLVVATGSPQVFACTFTGAGPHIILAPQSRANTTNLVRALPIADAFIMQNWFLDAGDVPGEPNLLVAEYPDGRAVGQAQWSEPVLNNAWYAGGSGTDATVSTRGSLIDISTPMSPVESTWSTENLLRGTVFDRVDQEGGEWRFETPKPVHWSLQVIEVAEKEFVGSAVEIRTDIPVDGAGRLVEQPERVFLVQTLVLPWSEQDSQVAWTARSWMRGRRLVGAAWIKASEEATVSAGFRETGLNVAPKSHFGRSNAREEDWELVSGFLDPVSVEYAKQLAIDDDDERFQLPHGLWGVDFVVRIQPPDEPSRFLVGAPQVTWGPDLIPVGPPRIVRCGAGANELRGPLALRSGFVHQERVVLVAGATAAWGTLPTRGLLEEVVFVCDDHVGADVRLTAEDSTAGSDVLAVLTKASGAGLHRVEQTFAAKGPMLIRLSRQKPDVRVEALISLRHSSVV